MKPDNDRILQRGDKMNQEKQIVISFQKLLPNPNPWMHNQLMYFKLAELKSEHVNVQA